MTQPPPAHPHDARSHEANVERQFGPHAEAYVTSAVHAAGEDLDLLEDIARRIGPRHALDLGSGGGHVAYRLGRHAGEVTACDLSAEMLTAVAQNAASRGLANVATRVAPAEHLPFADGAFDFLGCRFSAHHWYGFEAGLREARRVLAPGSTAVLADSIAPASPLLDTHLQAIELLRDTSHVRDYTLTEWLAAAGRAGFVVKAVRSWRLRIEFASWIARMRTPEVHAQAIRALQNAAPTEVVEHFAIEADGSFLLDTMLIEAAAG